MQIQSIIFFLLILLSPIPGYSQTSKDDIKREIQRIYEESPLIVRIYTQNFNDQFDLYQSLDNDDKYVESRIAFTKSRYCLLSILTDEQMTKFQEIQMMILNIPGVKEFERRDFSMLMRRELRKKSLDDLNKIPVEERHKLCPEKISTDLLEKIKNDKHVARAKREADYIKDTFETSHPLERKILLSLQKKLESSKSKMSDLEIDKKVVMIYISQVAPNLELKAHMEVIPMLEKKCPGKTEEIWKKCVGKQHFEKASNNPSAMLRLFCLSDHRDEVVPSCIEGKYLN